jgi:hypothetical protein
MKLRFWHERLPRSDGAPERTNHCGTRHCGTRREITRESDLPEPLFHTAMPATRDYETVPANR